MNAVSRDYDSAQPYEDSYARLDGRSRSGIEGELQRWGKWWEEKSEFQGHATASSIAAFLDGIGGGTPGSRYLAPFMPQPIYMTHQRFLVLRDNDREVIWNHYVAVVNPETGRCPTEREKAWLLGLHYDTYRKRLCRARCRMLGIAEKDILAIEPPARELTQAEADAAYLEWKAADKGHGPCGKLASRYGVTWPTMRRAISEAAKRAEAAQRAKEKAKS